jgi:hypothetical protein
VLKIPVKLRKELRILHVSLVGDTKLINRLHEGFCNEYATIGPKVAALVRVVVSRGSACFDSQILVPR